MHCWSFNQLTNHGPTQTRWYRKRKSGKTVGMSIKLKSRISLVQSGLSNSILNPSHTSKMIFYNNHWANVHRRPGVFVSLDLVFQHHYHRRMKFNFCGRLSLDKRIEKTWLECRWPWKWSQQWVRHFWSIYQTKHVTPYVRALAMHVPEFIRIYGSISKFNQQGLEKLQEHITSEEPTTEKPKPLLNCCRKGIELRT